MAVILEICALAHRYDTGVWGLQGLDLAVPAGSRLALLGSNGAGKSTLLLHLNGTLRPTRGQVLLDGQPVGYHRRSLREWRRQVGLVLQDPDDQLFAGTVYQDLSFGPLNLGLAEEEVRRRVAGAMEAMELEALADRPVHGLSLGQKKRVAIAGMLAMEPRVLILDEPTAGLDGFSARQLMAALDKLHQAGTTLIMATHDLDLAWGWADQVAVLSQGRLLRQGDPETLLQDQELLAASRLTTPWALAVGRKLKELGWLADSASLPRTQAELLGCLDQTRIRIPSVQSMQEKEKEGDRCISVGSS